MSLMKSNGLTSNPMRLLMTGTLILNPILTSLIGLSSLLMGSIKAPLMMVSSKLSSATATLSRIIIMMSGAEHSCSSLGKLSIHAGRSSMKTCAIGGCGRWVRQGRVTGCARVARLAHARHRVEAERREPERGCDVLPQGADGTDDGLGDVVGARRVAQRARGGRGQPARVRTARHVVALVGAVKLVPARDALLRDAVDLRLLHEHARVDQASGADAHAVHVVLVNVDQDATQEVAVDVRLGGAAHDGHRRPRRLEAVAPRVQVVVVRVGAHARASLGVVLVVACKKC